MTVCDREEVTVEGSYLGDAKSDFFDPSLDPTGWNQRPDVDHVADAELPLGDDENAGKYVADDLLGAEAEAGAHDRHEGHHGAGGEVEEKQNPNEGNRCDGEVEPPSCGADQRALVCADRVVSERVESCSLALDATGLEACDVPDDAGEKERSRRDGDNEETLVFDPVPRTRGAFGGDEQNHPTASITT